MKSSGKDKHANTPEQRAPAQQQERTPEPANGNTPAPATDRDSKESVESHEQCPNGKAAPVHTSEPATPDTGSDVERPDQDVEMKEISPAPAEVTEQDTPMMEAGPLRDYSDVRTSEGISQEDLDGGLLDGALDDDDDLDQDTEDTEVGNGEDDFSDDDDDDDDLDDGFIDSSDKLGPDDDMHSPEGVSHAGVTKSDDQDVDAHEDSEGHHDNGAAAVHSEDSDSDLPEPDGTDNEHEGDDEEDDEEEEEDAEGDGDEEDGEEEDMEEDDEEEELPIKKAPEPKKDSVLSQKPTLNRPPAPAEELKDSGDDLSDLSEFDDSDDSDDEDVPSAKTLSKDSTTSSSSMTQTPTATTNGRPALLGRKRSLHDTNRDNVKQDQESVKTEQDVQIEIPNGRARLLERKVSEPEDTPHSGKDSGSEPPEEEEEEGEEEEGKVVEEEEEEEGEEEDMETKQLHKDALEALTSIEVEFANLRDKMYEERMQELDTEVDMINAGTHPELSSLMQEIEQKREQRLRFAEMGKRYMIDIAESAYQIGEYRAHCSFQSARRTLRSDMVQELGKKQRKSMMELSMSFDTQKRKVIDDKSTLVRARKHKRLEANELRAVNEQRSFPVSKKAAPATAAELDNDFAAMGLVRPQQQISPIEQDTQAFRAPGQMPPSTPIPSSSMSSKPVVNGQWTSPVDYAPSPSMSQQGGYYGSRPEVEIYVDGSRCMIDGIWYKPSDSVVVLDASIGKYNAKYLFLANDEIMLQRTDGSKTRLHLGLFRGRKLCMQPKP